MQLFGTKVLNDVAQMKYNIVKVTWFIPYLHFTFVDFLNPRILKLLEMHTNLLIAGLHLSLLPLFFCLPALASLSFVLSLRFPPSAQL